MATALTVLRRELGKRIGLFHRAQALTGSVSGFTLDGVADAGGHWNNCWAWPTDGAEEFQERLITDYTNKAFTIDPVWDTGPSPDDYLEIHQFRPGLLTDILNWAIGDAFPEASVLQVIEMPVEADNAYTLPEAVPEDGLPMVRLLDVQYKLTDDSDWISWRRVEFALLGNGTQFELKEQLADSATLRVRGQRRLAQMVDETDEVEVDFPKTEILYACAAVRLYERARNLVPQLGAEEIDKALADWRQKATEMKQKHGDEPPIMRAKIPVL